MAMASPFERAMSGMLWGTVSGLAAPVGAIIGAKLLPTKKTRGFLLAFGGGALFAALSYELFGETILDYSEVYGEEGGVAWPGILMICAAVFGACWFWWQDRWLKKQFNLPVDDEEEEEHVGQSLVNTSAIAPSPSFKQRILKEAGDEGNPAVGLSVWLGMMIDGIPESVVFGIQVAKFGAPSWSFLLGICLADMPEAMGVAALWAQTEWKPMFQLIAVWFIIPLSRAPVTAMAAAFVDRCIEDDEFVLIAEGIAGGAMFVVIAQELLPEARHLSGSKSGMCAFLGFSLLSLVVLFDHDDLNLAEECE
jgi:zinc transporter ZupT